MPCIYTVASKIGSRPNQIRLMRCLILSTPQTIGQRDTLVPVSALNEFVYCPRRFYYQHYHDEMGTPYELIDGRSKHEKQSQRGDGSPRDISEQPNSISTEKLI